MKQEQNSTQTQSALLRSASWVDAPVNNSLCCAAAGITASSQATAEALIPHERLRRAAAPEATLIAQHRAPAQPALGYTHFDTATESPPQLYQVDKVPEDKLAELVGTTRRALQGKRARGIIPKGV